MSSLYDREAHRKWLRSALGEDLFLTKRGLERQSYRGPYFLGMLHDSHHQAAAQVLEAFEGKYVPVGARGNADVWFRHGFIRPSASAISTAKSVYVKPSLGLVVPNECIPARLLLDHVLGRQSLLVGYDEQEWFDCVLIDVDCEVDGLTCDLYEFASPSFYAELLAPFVAAVGIVSDLCGLPITAEFMLSGSKGFWLNFFFDGIGTRQDAQALRQSLLVALASCVDDSSADGPYRPIYKCDRFAYTIDQDSLGKSLCRLPWSMHQSTSNISVGINPLTGEIDQMQLLQPKNHFSLSDVAAALPKPATCLDADSSSLAAVPLASDDAPHTSAALDYASAGFEGLDQSPPSVAPDYIRWTFADILARAAGVPGNASAVSWQMAVCKDAPDGQKWESLVKGGNIRKVAAMMKAELGHVDWAALKAAYEAAYAGSDESSGGTIGKWISDLQSVTSNGDTIIPLKLSLSQAEVNVCVAYAHEVHASIKAHRKPEEYVIFRVLLCLVRLFGARDECEIANDYLARRAGLNPYPTWEDQREQEFQEGNQAFYRKAKDGSTVEVDVPKYPTSHAATERVKRVLKLLCDIDEPVSGDKPFVRLEKGTSQRSVPRASKANRNVGNLYRRVEGHKLWEDLAAAREDGVQAGLVEAAGDQP